MKSWRPVIILLAAVVLAHYGFLLVRSMREWNLQRENQLLRQQLLTVGSLRRDLAALQDLSSKLNQHLGPVPGVELGQDAGRVAIAFEEPVAASYALPLSPPVSGRISRLYERGGWPQQIDHAGIDIATGPGELVYAAAAGHVVFRDRTQRLGFLVLIDHGQGLTTGYGHMSMAFPEIGERVARGQLIGRVARGGLGRGSHLHFSTQRDGVPLDGVTLMTDWKE
ncbi:MAG: M23 family metallopeptidase [bacterium]|jgi:murein DD-endopeptidase MepM/ murein hydrolase activator NlpD|nr:M23 family metallopeptidase [bacterium]